MTVRIDPLRVSDQNGISPPYIIVQIEGSQPEWCISSMIYSRDTPFWSETLEIYHSGRNSLVIKKQFNWTFVLKFSSRSETQHLTDLDSLELGHVVVSKGLHDMTYSKAKGAQTMKNGLRESCNNYSIPSFSALLTN